MVSFQCESCGDVLTKKKLDPHRGRCRGATFSCIDCMVYFYGTDYRSHTSCMTEDQKYQGALYKNKNNNKKARINPPNSAEQESNNLFHPTPAPTATPAPVATPAPAAIASSKKTATPSNKKMAAVAFQQHVSHNAYVEDVPEELEGYLIADDDDNTSRSDDDAPPHAPTPPPVAESPVNVFDFLVAGATPNASSLGLPQDSSSQVVRYDHDANAYLDPSEYVGMDGVAKHHLAQYGTGAVHSSALTPFQTPAPAGRASERERRKKDKESSTDKDASKKDKKRKRLTVDINDQVMTDAPPVLHSGLTGGLHRLMTKNSTFPPSPESAETPASPLKKSKHLKHRKSSRSTEPVSSSIFSMLAATGSKSKTKKRKHHRSTSPSGKKHSRHSHHSSRRHSADGDKDKSSPKLLEYPSEKKDDAASGQMIIYKPRADLFLSFVNKGPESERGCSMNKALKRFHRERTSTGTSLAKPMEEKELFRSLRLRKNDRGEIVLFCEDAE